MSTAVTMSIIETAKANGLNPYKYLEWIFKTAPSIETPEEAPPNWALLLMRENAPDECRTKIQNRKKKDLPAEGPFLRHSI